LFDASQVLPYGAIMPRFTTACSFKDGMLLACNFFHFLFHAFCLIDRGIELSYELPACITFIIKGQVFISVGALFD